MTPEEDKYVRHLGQALGKVTSWENTVTSSASEAWEASPGSELATDDQVAHPYTVSSASWSAITAAVSHLGTLRDSLFREMRPGVVGVQLHTHGQLTSCAAPWRTRRWRTGSSKATSPKSGSHDACKKTGKRPGSLTLSGQKPGRSRPAQRQDDG